jgi:hypothetical protein
MFSESYRSAGVTPTWHRGHDVRVTEFFREDNGRGVVERWCDLDCGWRCALKRKSANHNITEE